MKIIGSPHPPAPSPKLGRRGAGAKSGVSCSLSQTWERAGVRASNVSRVKLVPEEIIKSSLTEIYISKLGLHKINNYMTALNGERASKEMANLIKKEWKIKILKTSQSATKKARELHFRDPESTVEVVIADKANIKAIVTHKLEDFSEAELIVMTLQELQRREFLEACLSRNTRERPAMLFIPKEVAVLNELYSLPSYTSNTASKSEIKQSSTTYSKEDSKAHIARIHTLKELIKASRSPGVSGQSLKAFAEYRVPKLNSHDRSDIMDGLKIDAIPFTFRVSGLNRHNHPIAMDGLKIDAIGQTLNSFAEVSREMTLLRKKLLCGLPEIAEGIGSSPSGHQLPHPDRVPQSRFQSVDGFLRSKPVVPHPDELKAEGRSPELLRHWRSAQYPVDPE
jgi:hypothetical protein